MWLYSSGHTEARTPRIERGGCDEAAREQKDPAAFQDRAVTLAVDSDQPMAQTARDLGINDHT